MQVYITTRVNGETTEFRKEVDDPFIRHTVWIEVRKPARWLPLVKVRTTVEVIVEADRETLSRWFGKDYDLPPGLHYDKDTGRISGTPTMPGTYTFDR